MIACICSVVNLSTLKSVLNRSGFFLSSIVNSIYITRLFTKEKLYDTIFVFFLEHNFFCFNLNTC
jgi:hypothetical protein